MNVPCDICGKPAKKPPVRYAIALCPVCFTISTQVPMSKMPGPPDDLLPNDRTHLRRRHGRGSFDDEGGRH